MRIAAAQIDSQVGDFSGNLQKHLDAIAEAKRLEIDLLVFSELSLVGYLDKGIAKVSKEFSTINDEVLKAIQNEIVDSQLSVAFGYPKVYKADILINLRIMSPSGSDFNYQKQILHEDEKPYFVAGSQNTDCNNNAIDINGRQIAFGICYESLQQAHILQHPKADIYIASVAKTPVGLERSYPQYSALAKASKLPLLMCNGVGHNGVYDNGGRSAFWNEKGELVSFLNSHEQALLVVELA